MNPLFRPSIVSFPITCLYRVWSSTLKYTTEGAGVAETLSQLEKGRPVIVAIWHNELFALPKYGQGTGLRFCTVVSQSKDGEILARVLERLDIRTARGSSGSGGVRALLKAQRIIRNEGRVAVVTIDGPRGPRHKVKDGVIYLAYKTGALLVPLRLITPKAYVFEHAWDKFRLPYPFSPCTVRVGDPYEVPEKPVGEVMDREKQKLESILASLG